MSIGTLTPEMRTRQKRILWILRAWVALGILGGTVFWVVTYPPSVKWGVPDSPERVLLGFAFAIIATVPIWVWSTYRYGMEQKWLAEDMGIPYEAGKRYPLWTRRRIVVCALGIAMFGISGIVPATTFDLPQFVATFLTVLYGPIEGGVGVGLGYLFIRGPIFEGTLNPLLLLTNCFIDGAIYFAAGHFYRQFIYPKVTSWRLTIGLIAYVFFVDRLHVGWFIPGLTWGTVWSCLWAGPKEAILAARAFANYYWCPIAWLPNIVLAYLVASALQRYKI